VPLTTDPKTFAWVFAIDDAVDGQGNGRHLYMQSSTNGNPFFLVDDNPGFSAPTQYSRLMTGLGTCTTVLVISSGNNGVPLTALPSGNPAGDLPTPPGVTSGSFAHGFTFQASTTVPTERLIVDLSPKGSRISIDSPWNASLGTPNPAGTAGVTKDWPLYSGYGGYVAAGQVALFATEVNVSSNVTSSSRFGADTNVGRASGFTQPIRSVNVNAAIQAPDNRFRVEGDSSLWPNVPGQFVVSAGGSVTASGTMSVTAFGANVYFEGNVTAPLQTYLLNAIPGLPSDPATYVLSTRSRATGSQAGTISSTNSISITMGNPAGGTVDLRTAGNRVAFQTGTANGVPYRYDVSIDDTNALQLDSVGSSSGDIAIRTGGNLTVLGDAIRTAGSLTFAATGTLSLTGSVGSSNGDVQLVSDTLTLNSEITADGGRAVTLRSSTGSTTTNALVRAGGGVKMPVKVASVGNVNLTAPVTVIDGVTLVANDRALLKNQSDPKENGIYTWSATGGGTLTRSADADASAKMQPGFVVFALLGTQSGAWVFRNATAPQFIGTTNQTPLSFVPATAARVFEDVKTATSANIALTGTPTINGVALSRGDRVLVKDQTNPAENGIYVVDIGLPGEWVRASDADAVGEMRAGAYVFIQQGLLGGQGWALANDAVQVGTTPLSFTAFTQQPPSALRPWAPATILSNAKVATTVNLASLSGLQTIDGVALAAGNIVLVKNQIDATKNGLYTVAAGTWTLLGAPLPRGGSLYVESGATNGGTAWQFNDSSTRLATTTLNSPGVTGLVTTDGLSVGMLVTGAGIPSGTTITSLGTDKTSLQLSSNAILSAASSPLTFTSTAAVSATTPIVFVPAGGTVKVSAAGSIAGSSSLQGATAVLTAGTGGGTTASLTAQTKVGRLSASAPGAITLTSGTGVELEQVRTTSAGGVTVTADGTLTALNVAAAGTTAVRGNIGLTSVFGDVITEVVTSSRGDISLTSVNNDVTVTRVRSQPANVSATVGNVSATANRPSNPAPTIRIDGRVSAQGTADVGDITLTSGRGQALLTGNAVVVAADTLKIDTPQAAVGFSGTAQIAAAALDLTAQFGATSYDPRLGTYQVVTLNRTDVGNIATTSAASLTVRGATTFSGGISFQAPDITVAGPIRPSEAPFDIVLNATAGDLKIDTPLTSPHDISLQATGKIGNSTGAMTPLLTTAGLLTIRADSSARVQTSIANLDAILTGTAAVLDVTEADSLTIDRIATPAGGSTTINVGTTAVGGSVTVKSIDMGLTGFVLMTAAENILDDGDATADIVANQANLRATTGRIDLDTNVNILTASAPQKNQTITIDDVGTTAATQLQLQSVATNNGNIAVTALRPMLAASVAAGGTISLTTTGATNDILVGSVQATGSTVALTAGGSIKEAGADATADVTATTITLVATAGSIDVHVDASAVAATATTVGSTIAIRDDNSLAIGDAFTGITGKAVSLNVGGQLTQTMPIVATSLAITASAGDVLLSHAANDVGSLTANNLGRAVTFRDANGFDIGTLGITGGAVDLTVGGALTQTGAVTATSLSITSTAGGPIAFNNTANDVDSISITNTGNDIAFTDRDDVAIGIFRGRDITITAGGALTQAVGGAITSTGTFTINFTGAKQPITLTGANDLNRFSIDNGNQPVTLNDINDLEIGSITAGAVTLSAGGNLTQAATAAIVAPSLNVSSAGGAIALGGNNDVGTLAASNAGRAVTFRDVNALGIAALAGGAVHLTVGGSLTQSAAITASSLRVDASAGDIALTNAGNAVGSITGSNPGRGFALTTTGGLTQSAGVVAGTLSVVNGGSGQVVLDAANNVDNVSIDNGNRDVRFRDTNAVNVASLTGGAVQLDVGGGLTQSGRIAAAGLTVNATTGSIQLTRDDNAVSGTFRGTTPAGNVSFFNAGGIVAGRVESGTAGQFNGNVHLKSVSGGIQLTDDVIALDDSVKLEARNGTIVQTGGVIRSTSLVWFAQAAPSFNTTATQIGQNLTQPGATLPPIVNNASGTITLFDNGAMSGDVVVTAPNASKVIIAGALVAGPGGKVDLRGINPNAVLEVRGDGDLQGTQILVPRSTTTFTWIVSGATAAEAGTSLVNMINRANTVMPKLVTQSATVAVSRSRTAPRPQPPRMSTISAETSTIEVQQSLSVVNVPVTFVTPATITAAGGAVSGSGLRLGTGASRSVISNLTFQGFAGTGIELDRVQNALIQAVTVNGGATGMSVSGLSTGTRIFGSTFRNVQTGLALSSASRLTFGGRAAGQANRIENAAREAVFATGFATSTQLIKTQYVGGSSQIVQRNVRGLRIVK
jgi:hypothetical protein